MPLVFPNLYKISLLNMDILSRFLNYISLDTQSDPKSNSYPSTQKQTLFLQHLSQELKTIGLSEVTIDKNGYLMATIPATIGMEQRPTVGFIAHVDTSPDCSGKSINPQVIKNYQGEDIPLGTSGLNLSPNEFPELNQLKKHTLITTDGTTLLGADDKAGVAIIVSMAEYLINNPQIAHTRVRIAFTPDEEIGKGVDYFDVNTFGAAFAYTVDGSAEGELEYENFNAASASISIKGRNIHPGYAKGKMLNALQIANDIHQKLPQTMRPEKTEGYEGFYHLTELRGSVDSAQMQYIIRDHCHTLFEEKKSLLRSIVEDINRTYGESTATLTIEDQYYNMKEKIVPHLHLIEIAKTAMQMAQVTPIVKPIRGGTDGARLSFMGLPCPNLFTGGMNFHGRYEYCSLDVMYKAFKTVVNIATLV